MVPAKRKTDKGVWSGVEGGITAEDDCEKLYAHTISSSRSHKEGRQFHLKGSMRRLKLDGSSHTAEMHFIHLEAILVEFKNRKCWN